MAAVFMAFSGAGDYSKCTYYLSEDGTNSLKVETRLAQEATAEILASKGIQIDRCVFLLTKKSRSINWEKYVRTDRNSGEISVEEEGILPRLERILPDAEIKGVDVPDPKEDQGLLEMFRIMYDALEPEDELYLEVTHGFRFMPMLYFPLINYARALKNITVGGIYYGSFDARDENGLAPILDLKSYDEILRWSFAAETFVNFGVSGPINNIVKEKQKILRKDFKEEDAFSTSLSHFTNAIQTSRGSSGSIDSQKLSPKNSISKAGIGIARNGEQLERKMEQGGGYPLLVPLVRVIRDSVAPFDKEDDVEIGRATVKWCRKNQMIQQGFTALEETIVSYVCSKCGAEHKNEVNRTFREAVSKEISAKMKRIPFIPDADWTDCLTEEARKIYDALPMDLVELSRDVKDIRNDINHFGMRKNPGAYSALSRKLDEYCEKFEAFLENDMTAENWLA